MKVRFSPELNDRIKKSKPEGFWKRFSDLNSTLGGELMKKEEFQNAVLTELRSLNKTLKTIEGSREREETSMVPERFVNVIQKEIQANNDSMQKELFGQSIIN